MFFKSPKRRLQRTRKPADFRKIARRRKPKIDLSTPNLLKPAKGASLIKIGYRLAILCVIISALLFLFFSTLLSFDEIVFEHDSQFNGKIEEEVMRSTSGKKWGMIPNGHIVFLNASELEKQVKEKFKGIEEITVKRKLPKKLQIGFKEKNGLVLICQSGSCVSLNDSGVASAKGAQADFNALGTEVEIVVDESQKPIEIGDAVNTSNFVAFVRDARKKLLTLPEIGPKEFYVPHPSATELKVKTAGGWLIYMDTTTLLEDQIDSLRVLLDNEIPVENRVCVEYIDQRISKRIFYKLVDDCEEVKKNQNLKF